jgi:hypothetical protein
MQFRAFWDIQAHTFPCFFFLLLLLFPLLLLFLLLLLCLHL